MKAAVLYEPLTPLVVEEVDIDEPGPGEVLVKMSASGVCHSDWHVVKGEWTHVPLPAVLGHEGAGVVEAVGPNVTRVKPGDHAILSWMPSCGVCEMCQKGWPNLCLKEFSISSKLRVRATGAEIAQMAGLGTFGAYQVVPDMAVVPIDKDVPMEQASLVGCGVMTGTGAAINTARVQPGTTVAVFGCGGVGLNCIQGSRTSRARRRSSPSTCWTTSSTWPGSSGPRTPSTPRAKTRWRASRSSPAEKGPTTPSRR